MEAYRAGPLRRGPMNVNGGSADQGTRKPWRAFVVRSPCRPDEPGRTRERHFMIRPMIRTAALAAVVLAATAAASAARAATPFDGAWSVLIVTEKGECDRAYRYPVRIQNG